MPSGASLADGAPRRVSIVVNNYNYGRYLARAIDSALTQSYPAVEVIVVDDGSDDNSRELLKSYAQRVHLILKPNGGQASAFNAGVLKVTGDYVLLLDSDDYLLPDAVRTCVESFPEGYGRVYFRLQLVDEEGQPIETEIPAARFDLLDGDVFAHVTDPESLFLGPPTSGNFFDASILRSALPVPEQEYRICADAYILMKTSLQAPVRGLDRVLGAYRIHGSNAFSSRSSRFSNRRRVEVQLVNYFRTLRLLQNAWIDKGRTWQPTPPYAHFWSMYLFCAGWTWDERELHENNVTAQSLLQWIGKYLVLGHARPLKRALQTVYLLSLVLLPRAIGRRLLAAADNLEARRPTKFFAARNPTSG